MPNKSFLSLVAADLLKKFGNNLHRVAVVFPNKRASLFLNQELARLCAEPVWAPRYTTMADLFLRMTDLSRAESIDAVCTLYRIYCEELGGETTETLDQFYGWGEMLLADFDDIDKHMADARGLFANIHDLQELSDLSFLTPEQEEALRHFFQQFDLEHSSVLRDRFLQLWAHMYCLYTRLKDTLQERGVLYEGALFRRVAEQLSNSGVREELFSRLPEHIVFAGFNVLNDVEERLMLALKKEGRALFYWDYDVFYTRQEQNEAGLFMRRNLSLFGNELPAEEFDNLARLRDITFISTGSDNAQARYVTPWLRGELDPKTNRNAIVLCDESQLLPVLHSIPHEGEPGHPKGMNATMGFPLRDTPVFSFITALVSLQTEGYDAARRKFRRSMLLTVQKHPYYKLVDTALVEQYTEGDNERLLLYLVELIEQVGKDFARIEQPNLYQQLYIEAIFQTHRILQQLLQLIRRPDMPLQVEQITLRRLLRSLMAGTNIPFHGEPATGIQIMGVLETRCLDFSRMLVLNLEEGKLPKNVHESSLIPATLREAFGLTTIRHKVAVYAYYFYRLIQRAEHVTCLYNENSTGATHHEISRFLRQLQAETSLPIRHQRIATEPHIGENRELKAEKTPEIMAFMHSRYACDGQEGNRPQTLSPTAINTYINCPLRFYYRYVAHLQIQEDPEDRELLPLLGTIFHDTAELIYRRIMARNGNRTILHEHLNPYVAQPQLFIAPLLDILFDVHLFHPIDDDTQRARRIQEILASGHTPKNEYYGEQIIYYNVLLKYLTNLLRFDLRHTPFTMVGMEVDRTLDLTVDTPSGPITLRTGGRVDRIDIMDGKCRIVDYKTGNSHVDGATGMEQIFVPSSRRNGYYLQTMLYALAELLHKEPSAPVVPALFFVGKAYNDTEYNPILKLGRSPIEDFADHAEEFMEGLKAVLTELFDPQIPFTQTAQTDQCVHCPYRMLCR